MHGLVDAAVFVNAIEIRRLCVIVARLSFAHQLLVRRITIHFVRTHEYKHGIMTVLARCFEKIYRAERIDIKIEQRDIRRLVMRRLSGAVDNQVKLVLAEQSDYTIAVAYIEGGGGKVPGDAFQPLQIPECVTGSAKKYAPHIIVRPNNVMALPIEILNGLGA